MKSVPAWRWATAAAGSPLRLLAKLAFIAAAANPAASQPVDNRPNVILLVADDLRSDDMPHFERLQEMLVSKGTSFRRYFTPNALCCPSRTSMLRGQFSHNHKIWTNFANLDGGFTAAYRLGLESETIGVWLQRAGYETALMGKYLNGYGATGPDLPSQDYIPPGWNRWFGLQTLTGLRGGSIYGGYNYQANDNGTIRTFGSAEADYSTDVLAAQALSFLAARAARPRKPFFLYLAPTAPHRPLQPARRHSVNAFARLVPSFPASFNEADVSDKPAWIQALPPLTRMQIERVVTDNRARIGSMLAVEDLVQGILDALTKTGELENTYIIFVSDNGLHIGEHRLRSKATVYDEAVRVPLIIRGPGVPAGETLDHMVYNHDLPSTIAAMARTRTAPFVDGLSLLPLLDPATRPAQAAWRRSILLEHREHSLTKASQPDAFSIRTDRYQYIEYVNGADRCELYLMAPDEDPAQMENRCGEPGLAAIQAQLASRLKALQVCRGLGCRRTEFLPAP